MSVFKTMASFEQKSMKVLLAVTRPIAFLGVMGMLVVAGVTVTNVLMRWLFGGGIIGLNEIVEMIFVVAVMATLPAGTAQRVHLRVDLLGGYMSGRLSEGLSIAGGLLLTLFLAILGLEMFDYAQGMMEQARETQIRGWLIGPFIYVAAALGVLSAIVQAMLVAFDMIRMFASQPVSQSRRSHPAVLVLAFVCLTATTIIVLYALIDFEGLSRLVQLAPLHTATLAFVALWLFLLLLIPVSAVMGIVGIFGTALFFGWHPSLNVFASEAVGFLTNSQVAAFPLFLVMGSFAGVAGLSDDVYRLAQAVLGRFRGGLALATIGGCAGFGAVTGSSMATAATFGRISLPQMKEHGYDPRLATGCVAAGGTLGALIPPSAPIILFALLAEASIGKLFVAAIIPGIIAIIFYLVTIAVIIRINPKAAPEPTPAVPGARRGAVKQSWAVISVFGVVIGGLYAGVFTVTESAAVGAISTFLIALLRGKLNPARFWHVMGETTSVTAMIYLLIFGALSFSYFVGVSQLPEVLTQTISGLNLSPLLTIFVIVIAYLILGSVMDAFAILVITVPIVTPLILELGYDLTWWGIVMLMVVETGLITPPFGMNLFLLRSIQPDVSLGTVFRGAMPFVLADLVRIALIILVPAIALWLPNHM